MEAPGTAPPPMRQRGPLLVVVVVVVTLLVLIPVVLLRPIPVLGSPLLVVLAEGDITAMPAGVTIPADFGPHCAQWWWDDRREVLTVETTAQMPGAQGMIRQHYRTLSDNFVTTSGDFVRARYLSPGVDGNFTSPVDERALAEFDRQGSDVVVDGTAHPPGDEWEMTFSYDVVIGSDTVQILEVVQFRNLGVVTPHLVPPAACM